MDIQSWIYDTDILYHYPTIPWPKLSVSICIQHTWQYLCPNLNPIKNNYLYSYPYIFVHIRSVFIPNFHTIMRSLTSRTSGGLSSLVTFQEGFVASFDRSSIWSSALFSSFSQTTSISSCWPVDASSPFWLDVSLCFFSFHVMYSSCPPTLHVLPCAWQQRSLKQQWTCLCCEPNQSSKLQFSEICMMVQLGNHP